MRRMVFIYVLGCVGMSLCFGVTALAQKPSQKDPCAWNPRTSPNALHGKYGNEKEDYFFEHVSEMNKRGGMFYYTYMLRNLHKTNVLPAEWTPVDIFFKQIGVNCCGFNSRNSGLEYKEHETQIKFGPVSQLTTDAPAYLANAPAVGSKHGDLQSRIYVKGSEPPAILDVTFRSAVKENMYTYTVTNAAETTVHFIIPALAKPFEENGADLRGWKSAGTQVYVADKDRHAIATFQGPGRTEAQELVVPVYLTTTEFKDLHDVAELTSSNPALIAKGSVSIYLPAVPK
jgi:hypothetical protein